jgi:hypothetical protein
MKAKYFFMLFIFFVSCSKEGLENINSISINPPSWIQGTWTIEDEANGRKNLKFTSSDFVEIDEDNIETSVISTYQFMQILGVEVSIKEVITTSQYVIDINYGTSLFFGEGREIYIFSKISDTAMSWDNHGYISEPIVYIKN